MDLRQIRRVWEARHAWDEAVPAEWYDYTRQVVTVMTGWFAVPPETLKDFRIRYGPSNCLLYNRVRKACTIVVEAAQREPGLQWYGLAHEVYHCVARECDGLRRVLWVDEMVAFTAAIEAMRVLGHGDEAHLVERAMLRAPRKLTVDELWAVRGYRWPGFLNPIPGLHAGAAVVGMRLQAVVRGGHLIGLARARSWADWLRPLQPATQDTVRRILLLDGRE